MHFQVRTDSNIENSESLIEAIRADVDATLVPRFGDQLRRVEVYLQDENSHKSGSRDKRCAIEVHLAGYPTIAVDDKADSIDEAVDGALEKMLRAIDKALGRLNDRGDTISMSGQET
jgi:ribosome-associated translation inhibitor RaiA